MVITTTTFEDTFEETASTRAQTLRHLFDLVDAVVDGVCADIDSSTNVSGLIDDSGIGSSIRRINDLEIVTLEQKCHCSYSSSSSSSSSASSWSNFFLRLDERLLDCPDISAELKKLISNTRFHGRIILDLTTTTTDNMEDDEQDSSSSQSDFLLLPPGVHSNLLISDSIFQIRSCRVYKNSFISNTYVASGATLINCGHVTTTPKTFSLAATTPTASSGSLCAYGTIDVTVGPETGGGRNFTLHAESTMLDITQQLSSRCTRPTVATASNNDKLVHSTATVSTFNVLCSRSFVRDTPTISNVYLYPTSSIIGASSVTNCTLFPHATIRNSSIVSNVIMQWNASITDNSKVDTVLMMEESHCGPCSTVMSTIMGPDTHASLGEIHSSIVGPNTNAHHQSLLIGVMWPLGRGNVGYGANVGSNHTGRIPDQEAMAGEGIFWGLSCVVKFPVDLSGAPYSIVAAGVTVPPQRITMPFSLIVENSSPVGTTGGVEKQNEIIPGWVLQSSPYTLVRNDKKFSTRRKARRHAHYTGWTILRPATIEMCRSAYRMLLHESGSGSAGVETNTVQGIGVCVLSERARMSGIKSYRDCIHRYILQGLLSWTSLVTTDVENGAIEIALQHEFFLAPHQPVVRSHMIAPESVTRTKDDDHNNATATKIEWPSFPWDENESSIKEWSYQREVLLEEFPMDSFTELTSWLSSCLTTLVTLEHDFAMRVAKCKSRDDTRGAGIIPGYADSHVYANVDPVVVDVLENAKRTEAVVQALLKKIDL
jgi:hypothetical protein